MFSDSEEDPTWYKISVEEEEGRRRYTSTRFNHYIINIGGAKNEGENSVQDPSIYFFNVQTYEWQKALLTGDIPQSRWGHSACLFSSNKIIVFGGHVDDRTSDDVLLITITQDLGLSFNCQQIQIQENNLQRRYHTAEIFQDKMFVFGGNDYEIQVSNELWSLDLYHFKWIKCHQKGDIPSPRVMHCSVLNGNKMYVFGGRNNDTPMIRSNNLFSLDLETLNWSEIQCHGSLPSPRSGMSFVEHKEFLYIFGGRPGQEEFSNELFRLNLKDNQWSLIQTKNEPPCGRAQPKLISYGNGIFVLGGEGNQRYWTDLFYLSLVSIHKEEKSDNLQKQMSQLYLNNLYSDVTFLIEGKKIFAHKMLLGTRCQFFSNMFTSKMAESVQKEIEITDCKVEIFEALLKYIYCGKIDFTEDLAVDLLVLCNKWVFKELEQECEDYLAQMLTFDNASERAQLANKLEAERLTNAILKFIMKNTTELEKRGILYEMPSAMIIKAFLAFKNKAESQNLIL